jgi:hypothetical protein
MKILLLLALAVAVLPARLPAWHMPVHRMITAAAIRTLPAGMRAEWGEELDRLAASYSTWPDIFAGNTSRVEELRPYNEVNGRAIHNVTWNRREDLESLEFLRRSIAAAVREHDFRKAAIFAGTLAHFIEDSTCPAHALTPWDSPLDSIRDLIAPSPDKDAIRLHAAIEVSSPLVDLGARVPKPIENAALLDAIYEGVRANRSVLLEMARAALDGDAKVLDPHRLRSATLAASLFADALVTAVGRVPGPARDALVPLLLRPDRGT